jgi:isopenicillin N synthase-like dioxygenase
MSLPILKLNSKNFSAELHQALKTYSFCILSPPVADISPEFLSRIYTCYKAFFDTDEKHSFEYDHDVHDGFISLDLSEKALGHPQKDLKEFFQYFPWGRCPDALTQLSIKLFKQLNDLSAQCISAIEAEMPKSIKLTMPLSKMIKGSSRTLLRFSHFPPTEDIDVPPKTLRAAEHSDINLISIQPTASIPGLECKMPDGSWKLIENQPGAMFVGVGEMLSQCTQGVYKPCRKRVLLPTAQNKHFSRISAILFLHPRSDVLIEAGQTASNILNKRLVELGLSEKEPI